jgi:hypothetical protein
MSPTDDVTPTGTRIESDQRASQPSEDRAATIARALQDAAARAVAEGWPPQAFMAAAQQAYLAASPELQEQLEAAHLLQHIELLRRAGRLADA